MKKIFSIFLCAAFVFALSANIFAEGEWYTSEDLSDPSVIDFRPSSEVSFYYEPGGTSSDNATNYQKYVLGTKHTSGDTVYGTLTDDSNIYKNQDDTYRGVSGKDLQGVTFPAPTEQSDNASTEWGEGWSKM